MPHVFQPYADTVARIILLAIVVVPFLGIGIGYWISASPYMTDRALTWDQPVPFSHQHHVGGLGLDCRYCHAGVETSAVAGVPPTHTCMTCHSQLYTQTAMLAPLRESLADNRPIHWNKVNRLPDYVYFDHSIHIAKGVGCSTCHGDVAKMPLMRQAAPLTMGWCLNCHRDPAPNLRPASAVFDPDWQFPDDQAERGAILAHANIDNTHLTDCSVCHR
jgi:Cytochrome c7 and related cytochrome c